MFRRVCVETCLSNTLHHPVQSLRLLRCLSSRRLQRLQVRGAVLSCTLLRRLVRMADMEEARARMIAKRFGGKAAGASTGGGGSVRRKKKAAHKTVNDDKKITAVVKKLGATVIPGIEEVNMFKSDNSVLHFVNPKVQSAVQSNTFVVSGNGVTKDISELLPGIISQLGPENMENLRALAEQFQAQSSKAGATENNKDDDDDDIPDLVDNFEEASKE